jgi:hypothetical protein
MEMASVLANEPWSDRPGCTDPLLAELARMVNDHVSDDGRAGLVVLIPEVIGVHGQGLEWEVALVAAVAREAVYDVPEPAQRALAAGLIRCDELAPAPANRAALDLVPGATAWARSFLDGAPPLKPRAFRRHSAPAVVRSAVRGLARGAVADPDARLRDLLLVGIESARGQSSVADVSNVAAVSDVAAPRVAR